MADDAPRRRGGPLWAWILLLIVVIVVLWLLLR